MPSCMAAAMIDVGEIDCDDRCRTHPGSRGDGRWTSRTPLIARPRRSLRDGGVADATTLISARASQLAVSRESIRKGPAPFAFALLF